MSETLKPCPFCGGEARLIRSAPDWYFPACMNRECACDWTDSYPTKAEAIAAWNTRATHGTLTAEQVRELIAPHLHARPTFDFGRHGAVWRADFQAIADELNARTERTCRDANTRFNAWTCSECKCTLLLMFDDYGEPTLNVDGVASVPNYCPNCGAKVIGG